MKYEVTIGLEVHCELTTNAKVFSGAKNTYSEEPNSNISAIDLAFPGIMPVINKEAVKKALKTAMAINCKLPEKIIFDRKNYYYPDLPKGFQLTQLKDPVGINGYLDIFVGDEIKRVTIQDTHLEEDTASLDHFDGFSLINYNRSGIPLLETVTDPCIHSADEAVAFLEALRRIFIYTGVSEAKTDKGQMRCDVNVSLAPFGSKKLGTKVEMKNINSFNNVREAIAYEIKRQTEALETNEEIFMETRRYDDTRGKTYRMRSKVDAVDYKFLVEPNLPPITIDKTWIEEIKKEIPLLPFERVNQYIKDLGITKYDALILVKKRKIAEYFETCLKSELDPQMIANFINTRVIGYLTKNEVTIDQLFLTPALLIELLKYISDETISTKQGKDVFYKCLEEEKTPMVIIEENNMKQITDDSEIRALILEVIEENKETAEEYNPEKTRMIDFFVGQLMKKTRGKANPKLAMGLFKEELEKLTKK